MNDINKIKANNYSKISDGLNYIVDNWQSQPDLTTIASNSGLSDFHFQRIFSDLVGISPKKFLSVITLEKAKIMLGHNQSIMNASYDSGLSGASRLHDLFIKQEAMSPGQYKKLAYGMVIRYGWHQSIFGDILIMITDKGLCGLAFLDDRGHSACFKDMADRWPRAIMTEDITATAVYLDQIFNRQDGNITSETKPLRILLKGTDFQIKIWQALLSLPAGSLSSYGNLAKNIGLKPNAARAVGTAVGMNPISWLIPCHMVIRKSGALGGYRWGLARKIAMLGYEFGYNLDYNLDYNDKI